MVATTQNKYFIYDSGGITKEEIKINFGTSYSNANYIIHRAYTAQTTQSRQGTHKTKTKAEVRGGGKKPWRQKGTGRARAGSNRSPLWRGGGIIFGPKNQHYRKKINKKERIIALQACLQNRKQNIIITSNFSNILSQPSTQLILQTLKKWEINTKDKILIVTKIKDKNLYLSIRNIPNIDIILATHLNIRSLLLAKTILISIDSIPILTEVYND